VRATYRLQLTPDFGFAEARAALPYLARLGVSHLYLSPITQARPESAHGYDVIQHNEIRAEFGGREGFEALRANAVEHGLGIVLDFVPNHAGVGPDNLAWQDVLAYGPHSPYGAWFDIEWYPLKEELRERILLPFLGSSYGDALDDGEIEIQRDGGAFWARYYDNRFALAPYTYTTILEDALTDHEREDVYFDLKDLADAYGELRPDERQKAQVLHARLETFDGRLDLEPALARLSGERLHELLERQFWRLALWKTAGHEINYRRFFNVNDLVALRMEREEVFWEAHRLLGELISQEGMAGVRIDHVDGLFDPHGYLENLKSLGARRVWVEKIQAPGETLPDAWPVDGTSGYEFLNDVLRLLVHPDGELPLRTAFRRLAGDMPPFEEIARDSKRLVMATSLASELTRLADELTRLSEADYHTRDHTREAIREALAETIADFDRYRTYLPHDPEEAAEVIDHAIAEAKRHSRAFEPSVFDFLRSTLLEEADEGLEAQRRAFVGHFQQYTAPVTAKGVEDTSFYRYFPLVALNEVGGEPDHFTVTPQAFHAHAKFRAHRYPEALVTTATHDHKRGADTRMRLVALAEHSDLWFETVQELFEQTGVGRSGLGELGVHPADAYFLFQHVASLWVGSAPDTLAERLVPFVEKAVREGKERSSWINPDEAYERVLREFTRAAVLDEEVGRIVAPLAETLAETGFDNALTQLVLQLTTPGVPDLYQGTELFDLSLVDPDNRRPVDFAQRSGLLDELAQLIEQPQPDRVAELLAERSEKAKLFLTTRLLRFRRDHPEPFAGGYRTLDAEGVAARHVVSFARQPATDEGDDADGDRAEGSELVVIATRFPATLRREGGWRDTAVPLPESFRGGGWRDVLSGADVPGDDLVRLSDLPLPVAVLFR
jgi:(1->4)-alpha-D-glucan 1-alpha-D-glucosylmutase